MTNQIKSLTKFPSLLLILILCVGVIACSDDDNGDIIDDEVSQQDKSFATDATFSNLAEIEMGGLAASKGTHESVVSFGELMVTEHTTAQNRLETIADSLSIAIPDSLTTKHQTLYDQLSALDGAAFDSAYITSQITAHQEAQQIFEVQIDDGDNDAVEDYASETITHINMHLEMAREIKEQDLGLTEN